jgi:hypothetical protein
MSATPDNMAVLMAVEKLLEAVLVLRVDVLTVADRVEAFDDEPSRFARLTRETSVRRPLTMAGAVEQIGIACRAVEDVDHDLAAIRNHLDQIASGSPKRRDAFAKSAGIKSTAHVEAEALFSKRSA